MNELNVSSNEVSVNSGVGRCKKKISVSRERSFDFDRDRHRGLRWNSSLLKSSNFTANASIILSIDMNTSFPFVVVTNGEQLFGKANIHFFGLENIDSNKEFCFEVAN